MDNRTECSTSTSTHSRCFSCIVPYHSFVICFFNNCYSRITHCNFLPTKFTVFVNNSYGVITWSCTVSAILIKRTYTSSFIIRNSSSTIYSANNLKTRYNYRWITISYQIFIFSNTIFIVFDFVLSIRKSTTLW